MSLRIAILGTRGIPNHYGGFERFAEHLAPALAAAGYEVFVYNSHNHPYKYNVWKGVHILHVFDPEYRLGSAGQFIYDLNCILDARKRHFDVILQLGYTSSSVWGRLFPKKCLVIYNMDGLEWQRTKYSPLARRFLRYAERLAVKYGDRFIADSVAIQSYLHNKYAIRSEYIAYGAEPFRQAGEDTLMEYGLSPSGYCLLIARMEPENNIEIILDGFSQSTTNKQFLVVGDPDNKLGRRLVKKFSKDRRICFVGSIYEDRKVHDLKFYSHLYFHGHSTGGTNPSLLEAMASRSLIVAHDNLFNREVLGRDAYYFSGAQEVAAIVDYTFRGPREERMIRNNLEKITDKYNWELIVSKYESFMLECLYNSSNERSILYRRYAD
jgi:glycosyltransferase involved in cell wall biosynthesis